MSSLLMPGVLLQCSLSLSNANLVSTSPTLSYSWGGGGHVTLSPACPLTSIVSRRRFGYRCLKGLKKAKHLVSGLRQQQIGAHTQYLWGGARCDHTHHPSGIVYKVQQPAGGGGGGGWGRWGWGRCSNTTNTHYMTLAAAQLIERIIITYLMKI